jgi:hypothetical protein
LERGREKIMAIASGRFERDENFTGADLARIDGEATQPSVRRNRPATGGPTSKFA